MSRGNLIPTPVVDRNGRLTTVHKRQPKGIGGITSIPAPKADGKAGEVLGREFANAVLADDYREEGAKAFSLIERGTLTGLIRLVSDQPEWGYPVRVTASTLMIARTETALMESRFQGLLAAAPLVEELHGHFPGDRRDKLTKRAFNLQARWGQPSLGEDSSQRMRGSVIACAVTDDANALFGMTEADALWLGENAEKLLPYISMLRQRKFITRDNVEPLLSSPSPAVTGGIL